ncbi:GNAT family N-acetyltransferase [Leucobacter insecticola]|uniref:GNAT family N-acetyltransferase n=1 Tax=Leucobacter insecticola TaxID=2714934 RepID=A0A6G8FH74_9MICO|nr:GNAT family N-acetyltransferase [Leucobacter insecticola]QIM15633.1 GNAT family N-acetyltransferase [Leucobacter insecticola]
MRHDPDSIILTRIVGAAADRDFLTQTASLLREVVAHGGAIGWVTPPPAEEVEELLRGVVADSPEGNACLMAAWSGAQLLGLGYWSRYTRATNKPHVDIVKLGVDPAARGQGIGRRIMQELIQAARDNQVEVVTLDLRGDNLGGIALYESLGFTRYGVLPRFVALGEDRYDKCFYALDLREDTPVKRT